MVNLASFWKAEACGQTAIPDRSLLIEQKLVKNAKIKKNLKCDFLSDFETLCSSQIGKKDETFYFSVTVDENMEFWNSVYLWVLIYPIWLEETTRLSSNFWLLSGAQRETQWSGAHYG